MALASYGSLVSPQASQTKLFVGGVGPYTTEQSLVAYFSRYGKVIDSVLMVEKVRGLSSASSAAWLLL